jgi:ribosomal protein L32
MGAIPRIWRNQRQRYTLTGQVCRRCGHLSLSPHVVCPQCHPADVEEDLRLPEAEISGELVPYIILPIDCGWVHPMERKDVRPGAAEAGPATLISIRRERYLGSTPRTTN